MLVGAQFRVERTSDEPLAIAGCSLVNDQEQSAASDRTLRVSQLDLEESAAVKVARADEGGACSRKVVGGEGVNDADCRRYGSAISSQKAGVARRLTTFNGVPVGRCRRGCTSHWLPITPSPRRPNHASSQ
jgi:hypothetical protein